MSQLFSPNLFRSLALLLALCWWPFSAQAKEPNGADSFTGLIIGGHDTVAYHQPEAIAKHKRQIGNKQFSVDYNGAKWNFGNKQNADAFAQDPERYTPAYNGHCANALSLGEGLYKTNGKTWEIFDDHLYVFYAPRGQKRWNNGNWSTYKGQADAAWAELSKDD
ncbi:MAG: YHS domain-containing protein [Saprospiraceae bacterium]|jgi:YHS domain-containing protein